MPIPSKRKYTVVADRHDPRDVCTMAPAATRLAQIPDVKDLRANFPPVYDQGDQGSCTAHGWAAALDAQRHVQGLSFMSPARDFIYGQERKLEGSFDEDAGAQVRTGAKVLTTLGAPPEALFAYDAQDFDRTPAPAVFEEAAKHRVARYARTAATVAGICDALAGSFPVVMGFTAFAAFESAVVAQSGVLEMPKPGEPVLGGHCVVIVGYTITARDERGAPLEGTFLVRNSWGADWGKDGYFTMPFEYAAKGYISDCWTIRETAG